jgi:dipeptidyl aminopeptidase/acylaminoacyl peptidase
MLPLTRRHLIGTASAALAALPLARPRAEAPPPPRAVFFDDPARSRVRISPNGLTLAWLEPREGVLNLVVAPVGDIAHPRQLTRVTARSISFYTWAYTDQHIVYFHDTEGDEDFHAFSVALDSGAVVPLLPGPGRTFVQQRALRNPTEMLFGHNGRDRMLYDLIRVNVLTGEARPLFENPGFTTVCTAPDFTVRFATRVRNDGSAEVMQWEPDGTWSRFLDIPAEDALTTGLHSITADARSAFVYDSRGRDKAALVEIDIATREARVLAEDPDADICDGVFEPGNGRPLAAISVADRARWHAIDPAWAFDLDHMRAAEPDAEYGIDSISHDWAKAVVSYDRSDAGVEFRLYDRRAQTLTPLFRARPALDAVALRPMRALTIAASDGVPLPCYLTLPAEDFHAGPVVMVVHGGPYARDVWGYSRMHQFLASRGYGVLSVNYRGSTGFGKNFIALADKGWGGRMQDDLTDAAAWLVTQGIADPKRLGFWGESYGGFAALTAATKTPDTFACIVDLFGPSNLLTMLRSFPPHWSTFIATWKRRLADPDTEDGRAWLAERSPLTHAERVSRPLLIGQGLQDVRVTPKESAQIVQALRDHGIPVTYVTFADEGHGFNRPENRQAFSAVAEAFLAQHLGGRAEPVGGAFAGSTIKFHAGRELIDGLG